MAEKIKITRAYGGNLAVQHIGKEGEVSLSLHWRLFKEIHYVQGQLMINYEE